MVPSGEGERRFPGHAILVYNKTFRRMEIRLAGIAEEGTYETLINYDVSHCWPSYWTVKRRSKLPPEYQRDCALYYQPLAKSPRWRPSAAAYLLAQLPPLANHRGDNTITDFPSSTTPTRQRRQKGALQSPATPEIPPWARLQKEDERSGQPGPAPRYDTHQLCTLATDSDCRPNSSPLDVKNI